ncbi:MAG: glycoside hydrolase family 28 protein [Verrucomicrobia bacterium]|nr:glycoside hydrolase family 28 protein [Verrucomicrobiota bacterium]
MNTRLLASFTLACVVSAAGAADTVLDICDFGAKPDGTTLCTAAIQKAIERCAVDGGGTVRLPAGSWVTGTIFLRSRVTLQLDAGCTLLGSTNRVDYLHRKSDDPPDAAPVVHDLIVGDKLECIAIRGSGKIDGNGSVWRDPKGRRPKAILLSSCRDVLVEGIRIESTGSWAQHYRNCDRLTIRGITVFNHASFNNDGLDVDSCRDVTITGCNIDSDDDALCLKSTSTLPCENVTISDCKVSSHCNGIKMGTESGGGFLNISISKCDVSSPKRSKVIYGKQRGLAGIALEIVDGGRMDRVSVSDIAIEGVSVPIFVRLGNRALIYKPATTKPGVGTLQNVTLRNITARGCSTIGCSITGLPDHPVRNVTLENIQLGFEGGEGKDALAKPVPERPTSYPESKMFGTLPAWGFYCRHVRGLSFRNVQLRADQPDLRHAFVCDDAEDVTLDKLDAQFSVGAVAMIRLIQSRGIVLSDSHPVAPGGTLLEVSGSESRRIKFQKNDLSRVGKIVETSADVPANAVSRQPASGAKP